MVAVDIDCQEGTKAEKKKDKNITLVVWTDKFFAYFLFYFIFYLFLEGQRTSGMVSCMCEWVAVSMTGNKLYRKLYFLFFCFRLCANGFM